MARIPNVPLFTRPGSVDVEWIKFFTDISTASGSGNVVGPASSIDDDIVLFDGVTGTLIQDSGVKISDLGTGDVDGPGSAVDDDIAVYDGITGKLIKDSGVKISDLGTGDVDGPGSAVNNHVAAFDGVTGKLIKDSGVAVASIGTGDVVGPGSAVDDRIATFDGTTGKLIQDGGYTIAAVLALIIAGNLNAAFGFSQTTIADAGIKTLNSVPVTMVAAPGAARVVLPICLIGKATYAGGYSGVVNCALRHVSGATDITNGIAFISTVALTGYQASLLFSPVNMSAATIENKAIVFRSGSDVTGGNAANTLSIGVMYVVFDALT